MAFSKGICTIKKKKLLLQKFQIAKQSEYSFKCEIVVF